MSQHGNYKEYLKEKNRDNEPNLLKVFIIWVAVSFLMAFIIKLIIDIF
jgi:hypothetical protein